MGMALTIRKVVAHLRHTREISDNSGDTALVTSFEEHRASLAERKNYKLPEGILQHSSR